MIDRSVDKEDPMISGVSPKDLAMEAVLEVLEKYQQAGNPKTEKELFSIAATVMWHDFLDLVESSPYKTSLRIDDIVNSRTDHEELARQDGNLKLVEDKQAAERFYRLADGDQELIDFIDAVVELKVYKREDIAELLGVTPQEVTNRARRLRYRHTSKERKASKVKA
jgi:hypothetical protein